MFKDLKKHKFHYFILLLLLSVGIFVFLQAPHNLTTQRVVVVYLSCSYFLWGVIHHWYADKVTLYIVLEYALVAVLGLMIANTILIGR